MRPSRPPAVDASVILEAPADLIWEAVKTPAAFRQVTRRLVRLVGLARRDQPWQEGETVHGPLVVFECLPISVHHLTITRIDERRRELHSDEHGGLIRRWRHIIRVTPLGASQCRYEDVVEIEAGWITPIVVGFARWFYGVRQRRWQSLARQLNTSIHQPS
jgi:hypothetical protein